MKLHYYILGMLIFSLILLSCPMPQSPDLPELPDQQIDGSGIYSLSVETDSSRNQGVYINEKGVRIDIYSEEEGIVVNCVEAIDIAVLDRQNTDIANRSISGGTWVKAIVIGRRGDGKPGAWEIHGDDSIHPLWNEDIGRKSSLLSESYDRDGGVRGLFGWVYTPLVIVQGREEEMIIVGLAVNERGFRHRHWGIEQGTTVAVYWKVRKSPHGRFHIVSPARVIGTPKVPDHPFSNNPRKDFLQGLWSRILSSLRLFFLHWFESYFIAVYKNEDTGEYVVYYDSDKDVYVIRGTDQDEQEAIATIDKDGRIVIEPVDSGESIDLSPGAMTFTGDKVADGSSLDITLQISNSGSGTVSGGFSVNFYLSEDTTFATASDTALEPKTVNSVITGNTTINFSTALLIPEILITNYAYIYAVVDSGYDVAEIDEANNQSAVGQAAYVLVYDDETAPGSYDIIIETFPPTGSETTYTYTDLVLYDSGGFLPQNISLAPFATMLAQQDVWDEDNFYFLRSLWNIIIGGSFRL